MPQIIYKKILASALFLILFSLTVFASDKIDIPTPEKMDSKRMSNIMNLCIVLRTDNDVCDKQIMKKCQTITSEQGCTKMMTDAIASRVHTKDTWE